MVFIHCFLLAYSLPMHVSGSRLLREKDRNDAFTLINGQSDHSNDDVAELDTLWRALIERWTRFGNI